MTSDGGFGVYVHWPFCESKCPYCDFNSHVVRSIDQDAWRDAYLMEIDRYAAEFPDRIVRSIFFGGGTPSLMDPRTTDAIINRITSCWRIENSVEVTLEANPSSVEAQRFADYRSAGVNRVSLGIQALNDKDLKALGRLHSADEARKAMDIARSIFSRTSFDLICARQDQSLDQWCSELNFALSFGFNHMSLYQLTIEDGTAFADRFARGKLKGLPSEDTSADMFDATIEICETAGLKMYEVSNFALPGQESTHNLIYWNQGEYLGIGPGAHGRMQVPSGQRAATESHRAPQSWLSAVKTGSGESARDILSNEDWLTETLLMGLRLRTGIPLNRLHALGFDPLQSKNVQELLQTGFVEVRNAHIIVPDEHVKLLNAILERVLAD